MNSFSTGFAARMISCREKTSATYRHAGKHAQTPRPCRFLMFRWNIARLTNHSSRVASAMTVGISQKLNTLWCQRAGDEREALLHEKLRRDK
jgi:hypothetical protein